MSKMLPISVVLRKTKLPLFHWKGDNGEDCFAISPIQLSILHNSFKDAIELFVETFNSIHGEQRIWANALTEQNIIDALSSPNRTLERLQKIQNVYLEPLETSIKIRVLLEAQLEDDYTAKDFYAETYDKINHPFLLSWALEESIGEMY